MEPFVSDGRSKSPTTWYLVAAAAVAFLVWQFNLIPSITPAHTGTTTTAEQALPSPGPAPWDEIVDHHGAEKTDGTVEPENDPLLHAIQGGNLAAVPTPVESAHSATNAFFELDEPDASDVQSVAPAVAEANVGTTGIQRASYDQPSAPGLNSRTIDLASTIPIPETLAEDLRVIDDWNKAGNVLAAHERLSRIYWEQPEHRAVIRERIELSASRIYASREPFGEPHFVEFGDTLDSIAKQYQIPWEYLGRLNGLQPEQLQAGQSLKVIKGPFSAVVDLDSYSLTVHAYGWFVRRYRIGIGKDDRTPVGKFTVQNKLTNPTWYNPDGGVVDADDPQNPLGEYWIGLGNHIGIHGTVDPTTIGRPASRGCVHLADGDIDEVFLMLGVGSQVLIRR